MHERTMRPMRRLLQRPLLGVFAFLFVSMPSFAQYVDIIVQGTVSSGTDTSGVFGPPNTNLAGQPFTVTFIFNGGFGTQSNNGGDCVKTVCVSSIDRVGAQSPGIAFLTIGSSAPYLFDVNANPQGQSYVQRNVEPDPPFPSTYFETEAVDTPFGSIEVILQRDDRDPFTIPGGWSTPFSDSGPDNNSGAFGIALGSQSASGQLAPQSVVVTAASLDGGKLLGDCSCKYNSLHGVFSPAAGDPIDIAGGNVFYQTTDYTTAGQNPLSLTRYYNSLNNVAPQVPLPELSLVLSPTLAVGLGRNWRSSYDRYLKITSPTTLTAERPDGRQLPFTLNGSTWTPDADIDITLANSGNQWTLTDRDDTVETYSTATLPPGVSPVSLWAQLNSVRSRNGYTQTMSYNGSGQLASVTDSYGRALTFAYSGGLLQTVTTPDNTAITYAYASATGGSQLTSATFPTTPNTTVTYLYTNSALPFALTGITDEDGNSYATWTYDGAGRGLTSQRGNGANLATVAYNDMNGARSVTNAFGVTDTYTYTTLQGIPKVTQISRAATSTTAAATETFAHDSNGYLASATDWNGNQTAYTNNSHGLPTAITEAAGSNAPRMTTIAYDAAFVHLPDSIVTPGLTTSFTYDGSGNVLTLTLTDTTTQTFPYPTNGQTRTWTNTWSNFLLAAVKTPNGNTTTFGYDGTGALTSITDALSHITSITAHTGGGRPLTIVDPNNVTTTLTYDQRQRLLGSSVSTNTGVRTTSYAYDAAGNLTKRTLPDNSFLANTYDTAHRITQITDALGNSINFTLDALGDRTLVNIYDPSNTLRFQHSGNFDALGRLLVDTAGAGQTTTVAYDPNGNLLTVKDGLSHTTTRTFDALNRLSKSTDANSGVTQFAYEAHDRITTVTDANNNATAYVYDGFGDAIQQLSPDSGTTVYRYDADANLTQKVDAVGNVTNQTFDALDRILATTYPADSTLNVSYGYDTPVWPANGGFDVGRLTTRNDSAGFWAWDYDQLGNTIAAYHPGSPYLNFAYQYDAANRLANIYFPDNFVVGYTRDAMGNATAVNYLPPGGPVHLTYATLTYAPFGPETSASFANGITETRAYDLDYRLTNVTAANSAGSVFENLTYALDNADNVISITDAVNAFNSQTFGYDAINRLTGAASGSGGYGSLSWTYDKVGNRLTQTAGSATTAYGYASGTNRLASLATGGVQTPVGTNANGNITGIPPADSSSPATFAYSAANRLASVTGSPLAATFVYDAEGRRFSKANPGSNPILYAYSPDDAVIEENNDGAVTDYLYVNGRPIGTFVPASSAGTLYYLDSDRLGTPQLATDGNENAVWSTSYQPFGLNTIPTGTITQSLRLPGQYFDSEAGFNYNLNRDYMPNLGRYLEADPIGLGGGMNPYLYASGSPDKQIDPLGLSSLVFVPGKPNGTGGEIVILSGSGQVLGRFPSGNRVDSSAAAPQWPEGTYAYKYYKAHLDESDPDSSYGTYGIFVFDAPQCESGCGIHSGRRDNGGPSHPTFGCIRTTDTATGLILQLNQNGDPLTTLTVLPRLSYEPGYDPILANFPGIGIPPFTPASHPLPLAPEPVYPNTPIPRQE